MDLFLVLDSSASIGSPYYYKAKIFLADLVSRFTVGKDNVRVGSVVYGSEPYLVFDLQESFSKDENINKIEAAEYLESSIPAMQSCLWQTLALLVPVQLIMQSLVLQWY